MSEVEIDQVIDPEGRLVSRLDATAVAEKKRDSVVVVDVDGVDGEDADIFDNEEDAAVSVVTATKRARITEDKETLSPDQAKEEEEAPADAVKHTLY